MMMTRKPSMNVAIKIKKMRDDDTRKIVEEEDEDAENDQSLDRLRRSNREKISTKMYAN